MDRPASTPSPISDQSPVVATIRRANPFPLFIRFFLKIFGAAFSFIKFPEKSAETIRAGLESGTVIHVFQHTSYLEYLILNDFLRRNELPPVYHPERGILGWVLNLLKILLTFGLLRDRRRRIGLRAERNQQFLLFLQQKEPFLTIGSDKQVDRIQNLLAVQAKSEHPIFVIPHVVFWSKSPDSMTRSYLDMIFGNSIRPGRIRMFITFLRNFHSAFVRSGEPINLRDFLSTRDPASVAARTPAKELRWRLFSFFSEERTTVAGPLSRPRAWIIESVINSGSVQDLVRQVAAEEKIPEKKVIEEAARELDFMAADYKHSFINLANLTISPAIDHLYNPVVVDREGIEQIRELLKKSAVVFVPSHKSHMDYLTWSSIMYRNEMAPPHIIAGENLAFWPMGFIFRRMGAIFIRRSFKGNRLYSTLLRSYLVRTLMEGYSIEFFIEGGRSRTGKLLMPKFGILSMFVEAFFKNTVRDIVFVPVSLVYSKLIEEKTYTHELKGGQKKEESTGSLIKVIDAFKLRYGGLYVRVGEPIHLRQYFDQSGLSLDGLDPRSRQTFIQNLGLDLIARINNTTTAIPSAVTALALLTAGRKGVTQKRFLEAVEVVLAFLKDHRIPVSLELADHSLFAINQALQQFLRHGAISKHLIGNEIVYTIREEHRHSLDFYKNYIFHYFAPNAFLAAAFLALKRPRADLADVREKSRFLTDLFRFEIVQSPRSTSDSMFDAALEDFLRQNALVLDGLGVVAANERTQRVLPFYQGLLSSFLESYWVVARALVHLLPGRMTEKRFFKLLLDEGKKLSLLGELEHSEAYSKANFQNAVLYFIHRGAIVKIEEIEDTSISIAPDTSWWKWKDRKRMKKLKKKRQTYIELCDAFRTTEALKTLADELRSYLER